MPKFERGNPNKIILSLFSKVNQVIYFSPPISLPSCKTLAQIVIKLTRKAWCMGKWITTPKAICHFKFFKVECIEIDTATIPNTVVSYPCHNLPWFHLYLSSNSTVSYCYSTGLCQASCCISHNQGSDIHHRAICQLCRRRPNICSIFLNLARERRFT